MAAWAQAVATILAVVIGAWLSVYVRGQQLVKVSEKRLDAYAELWALTKRLRRNGPDLTDDDLRGLADEMTDWYYRPNCGMLATAPTVAMFLAVRANLTAPPDAFYPESWRDLLTPLRPDELAVQRRQRLLARQCSLLRTQMKLDCAVYYGRHVSPERLVGPYEVHFIDELSAKPGRAWRRQIRSARRASKEEYLADLGLPRGV